MKIILIIFCFLYISCVDKFDVMPMGNSLPPTVNEDICNLISSGDCGTFESNIDGMTSGCIPWCIKQDTLSFEGRKSIKAGKFTIKAGNKILSHKDSIRLISGRIYNVICYINVKKTNLTPSPVIFLGFEPYNNEPIQANLMWSSEEGFGKWLRLLLRFEATSNNNVLFSVFENNVSSFSELNIDKFKVMIVNSSNMDKCCFIPDPS